MITSISRSGKPLATTGPASLDEAGKNQPGKGRKPPGQPVKLRPGEEALTPGERLVLLRLVGQTRPLTARGLRERIGDANGSVYQSRMGNLTARGLIELLGAQGYRITLAGREALKPENREIA